MNNIVTSLPIFSSLTPSQKQAVFSKKGMILVSAGAGSGKTKALSLRAYYLIKSGVKISSLLILTFTNKAAAEMKKRIRELVAKDHEIFHLVGEIDSSKLDFNTTSIKDIFEELLQNQPEKNCLRLLG